MRNVIYYILVWGLCSGCSREDWFDVKSDKQIATPESLEDLQALLDNASLFNTFSPCINEISSDCFYFKGDILPYVNGHERNAYTWSKEEPNRNVTDWVNGKVSGSYGRVYCANLILETVEKFKSDKVNSFYGSVKGQALFQRGRTFFELAQVFSPAFNANTKMVLGLPLRLESDVSMPSKRNTVEETYKQILDDLTASLVLLPETQQYVTRPSKLAAYALLARVHLAMENYIDAEKYATLCLEKHNVLIDYNSLNMDLPQNPFVGYNKEVIFYSYMNGSFFSPSMINVDSVLYKSYALGDLRRKAFYLFDENSNSVNFIGSYSGLGFDYFFNGLATDEMYLIRAECNARKGEIAKSLEDLNLLLKNRFTDEFIPITTSDSEEALQIILTERKKELIFRGVRWSDLRRLNRDPRFVQTFNRTVNSKTYLLEPNSYKYTFPIPDDIIEFTGMKQNPGWE